MAIYKGLNVSLYLGDVDNLTNSLSNLGLEIADLDRIRGLGTLITRNEFHLLSGLDLDQEKETYSLYRSANVLNNELLGIQDISRPMDFNIRVNDQLRAGAIKYSFLQFNNDGSFVNKSADISTSRVSSWSKIGAGPIFYGADVNINPFDSITSAYGDPNKSIVSLDNTGTGSTADATLIIQGEISPKRFEAEETTDLVTLNINGEDKQFYAMRSIPTSFFGYFRNASLTYETEPGISDATPTFVFADLSTDPPVEIPINGSNTGDTINFSVTRSSDRRIDLYFRPDGFKLLRLQNIKMLEFPNTVLKNLETIDVAFNDISEMPDWYTIAGAGIVGHEIGLKKVTMTDNGLDRSPLSANTQLHSLPSSVEELYINGCFRDNVTIDIASLPNADVDAAAGTPNAPSKLKTLQFDAYYSSYGARQMTDTGVTPEINENEIRTYYVRRQPYRTLAKSVQDSTTLQTLNCHNLNLTGGAVTRGTNVGASANITIASNVISSIDMAENAVNIINVSNKTNLTKYYHYRNWSGGAVNIDGYFNGCSALSDLRLYHTYVTGTLNTAFTNLKSLGYLHLYNTRLGGNMGPGALVGNDALYYLNVSHGTYDTQINNSNNFFGNSVTDQLNPIPDNLGSQYSGGYYAGKMQNSATDTPYDDAYSRPAGEDYYLIVADKEDEFIGSYTQVTNHCNNLVSGGFSDWDVPTPAELELMYRNLKPTTASNDTSEPDLQAGGGNPHSVPAYNRTYTSNSPGQSAISIFKSGGSQALSLSDMQNYIAGTSGWNAYNDATTSVSGSRVEVIQDAGSQDGGVWKGPFTIPSGAYNFKARIRYIAGTGSPDDVDVEIRTAPDGGGTRVLYDTIAANIDAITDQTAEQLYTQIPGGTYYLHFTSERMDFSIDEFSLQNVGSLYYTDYQSGGDATAIDVVDGSYLEIGTNYYIKVRPVRRVPVRTGIQIEQEFSSDTFRPVPLMTNFYLRYRGGIRGKFPNVGYMNKIRYFYVHNTGLGGPIPDFSFANGLINLYVYNNQHDGTFQISNSRVSRIRIYNNNIEALGPVECPNMWEFHASNNNLQGNVPDWSSSSYLHDLYLSNNNLNNYVSGSFSTNRYLRKVFLNNNNLTLNDSFRILTDLALSWQARNRSNCQVNLIGNADIKESSIVQFPEFFGILEDLRGKGWTILLNP
jgi:hypothetical protein